MSKRGAQRGARLGFRGGLLVQPKKLRDEWNLGAKRSLRPSVVALPIEKDRPGLLIESNFRIQPFPGNLFNVSIHERDIPKFSVAGKRL